MGRGSTFILTFPPKGLSMGLRLGRQAPGGSGGTRGQRPLIPPAGVVRGWPGHPAPGVPWGLRWALPAGIVLRC